MSDLINIPTKSSGDTLSAGEVNTIVNKTNDAITEQNQTKATHEQALANKVDKVTGKGLSTEDFTTAEKTKLSGVAAGANNYDHPATHPLSMITETETLKVMTAAERTKLAGLSEHDKGFFANEAAIIAAIPEGQAGWFVRNGETDTVWVWDVEGSAWVDTGSAGGGSAYLEVTYAQAIAAMGAGTLVPGAMYKITDRGDRGLFFNAISTTQFAATGTRLMLCPATYAVGVDAYGNNWIGIWDASKSVEIGDLAIFNGMVWKNKSGTIGSQPAPMAMMLDFSAWGLVSKPSFTNSEYVVKRFTVEYDIVNDYIYRQSDSNGNTFGVARDKAIAVGITFQAVDVCDWNCGIIYNNRCYAVLNNPFATDISDNDCMLIYSNKSEVIRGNHITGGISVNTTSDIIDNSNLGSIEGNACNRILWNRNRGSINMNSNTDDIISNSNNGDIDSNSNSGEISLNCNSGHIEYNSNTGRITMNSNKGIISSVASSVLNVEYNSNVGNISNCSSTVNGSIANNSHLTRHISGEFSASVSDYSPVDKTGGA